MIELLSYSQDVPVNGDVESATNYLVFKMEGNTFRVRVGLDTIRDLITVIESSPKRAAPVVNPAPTTSYEDDDEDFDEEMLAPTRFVDEDEDKIPSL